MMTSALIFRPSRNRLKEIDSDFAVFDPFARRDKKPERGKVFLDLYGSHGGKQISFEGHCGASLFINAAAAQEAAWPLNRGYGQASFPLNSRRCRLISSLNGRSSVRIFLCCTQLPSALNPPSPATNRMVCGAVGFIETK